MSGQMPIFTLLKRNALECSFLYFEPPAYTNRYVKYATIEIIRVTEISA